MESSKQPRVVILTTYPLKIPRHGGQLRASGIRDAYRAAGFVTDTCAIVSGVHSRKELDRFDVHFPSSKPEWQYTRANVPFMDDFSSGAFSVSSGVREKLRSNGLSGAFDVIHLEQPWLWPLAQELASKQEKRPLMVYGSQNIEHELKRAIFDQYDLDGEIALEDIRSLESQVAESCDLVIACTNEDGRELGRMGAKSVVCAPNGISFRPPKPHVVQKWRPRLPRGPWAFFIGSAHPPNMHGFAEVIGSSLAFLPPNARITLAGGAARHILQHYDKTPLRVLNNGRLYSIDQLDDDDLDAVKSLSRLFILPILQGGGSNIKTAEALFSQKKVIGTKVAFRGFHEYTDMPGVTVADNAQEFRMSLQEALSAEVRSEPRGQAEQKRLENLLWHNALRPIPDAVSQMLASR